MQAAITAALLAPLLKVNIETLVDDAIAAHDDDLVIIQKQQLNAGQTAKGTAIVPFYHPVTLKVKQKKGQPTDRVTLKDKGGFYDGTYARPAGPGKTELGSTDPVTKHLEQHYGPTIFGLSVVSRAEFSLLLRPTIQTLFQQAIR